MKKEKLANWKQISGLTPRLEQAFIWVEKHKYDELEVGRHEIDGDNIFVMVVDYTTKSVEDSLFEAHHKYIDIQIILDGNEKMYWCGLENMVEKTKYNLEQDLIFYKHPEVLPESVVLLPNEFIIFEPQHAHMPGCNSVEGKTDTVKKLVVKVKV